MAWMAVATLAALTAVGGAAAPKPHILLILADDYGWANLGVHRRGRDSGPQGAAEVHTPTLDSLVDAGVLLERHYAYKICSPSRSSLQSGRLAVHVNTVNTGVTVMNASDPVSGAAGIPRNMTGVAQKLRLAGYRTHMVGKWDAGMATPEHTPLGRGYETWVGYFQHANDYWRKGIGLLATGEIDNCLNSFTDLFTHNASYRGGVRDGISMSPECLENPTAHETCYEEYLFKERALSVVREHDTSNVDAPMFLFYAFHLLHTPLQVPESYLQRIDSLVAGAGGKRFDSQGRRLYAAMTLYMDDVVGELVSALKAKGMWDNTLIIFTSDNGGPIYVPGSANNHPLKGGKFSDWEGGVRVNAFLSGGFIPPEKRGTRYPGVVSIADWYGTLCELAGVDSRDEAAEDANAWLRERGLPVLPPVDSVAVWGFILNGTNARPSLHLSEDALLEWPFKLVTGQQPYARWQGGTFPNCSTVGSVASDGGPAPMDLKVFNIGVTLAISEHQLDKITWVQDCRAGCLFNVELDPEEHSDLAGDPAHAAMLLSMAAKLQELNKGIFRPARGTPSLAACEVMVDNGGYYGPFVGVDGWYSPLAPQTPGERQKDESLKKVLRLVNFEMVEKGVAAAAQAFVPTIRREWLRSMDRCLSTDEQPAEAIVI